MLFRHMYTQAFCIAIGHKMKLFVIALELRRERPCMSASLFGEAQKHVFHIIAAYFSDFLIAKHRSTRNTFLDQKNTV